MASRVSTSRRIGAILCNLACAGLLILALSSMGVSAVDEAKCNAALQLQNNRAFTEFKACAGSGPIPTSCCLKLLPFISYMDCLQEPRYRAVADAFLAPATTVDRAMRECLGS